MQRIFFIMGLIGILNTGNSQPLMTDTTLFRIRVVNEKQESAEGARIELINANNKSLEKAAVTDAKGVAAFNGIAPGEHYLRSARPATSLKPRLFINFHSQISPVKQGRLFYCQP